MARVNRAVELLAAGQPIYYTGAEALGREGGRQAAGTWADYLNYEMEHAPYDVAALREFMAGLVEGGPTRSGHRSPPVIVTLPMDGTDERAIRASSWVIKQILATGVHGLLLCHAESPGAVRAFVETCRYPFNTVGVGRGVEVGRRGGGGQRHAAEIWGLEVGDYLRKADPWPLNPEGELLLGLKIENVRALSNVEASLAVPGIAFAEWGPGDMGMSMGFPDNHDEPYPAEMQDARERVFAACRRNNVAFLSGVYAREVEERIKEGVMICSNRDGAITAERGRKFTNRTMPW